MFVSTQFDFRENYLSSLALAHLHELVVNELDKNNSVCALFLGLDIAFDSLIHKIRNNTELEVSLMILSDPSF